jgi:hypothetical protein
MDESFLVLFFKKEQAFFFEKRSKKLSPVLEETFTEDTA